MYEQTRDPPGGEDPKHRGTSGVAQVQLSVGGSSHAVFCLQI